MSEVASDISAVRLVRPVSVRDSRACPRLPSNGEMGENLTEFRPLTPIISR